MDVLQTVSDWASLANIPIGVAVVYAFLTGRVFSARAVDQIRADRDTQFAELRSYTDMAKAVSESWKDAYLTTEEGRAQLQHHLATVLREKEQQAELVRDMLSIVQALQQREG